MPGRSRRPPRRPSDDRDGKAEYQRLLLPSLEAAVASLAGRRVLDIGGRMTGMPDVVRHLQPTRIPWPRSHFHAGLSVDVVPLLPPEGLDEHLSELARVVGRGGRVLLTVPLSPAVVFTDAATDPDVARKELERALAPARTEAQAAQAMLAVPGVTRATVITPGRPILVDDRLLEGLPGGTPGLLRLPDRVVRHRVYRVADVVAAARSHRLIVENVECRSDPLAGTTASPLGPAYADHPPHAVLHAVRD